MSAAAESMTIPRCICGREVGELVEPTDGGCLSGSRLRLVCPKCRDLLVEYYFEKRIRPGRLIVLHILDLDTGEICPDEVTIVQDFVRGDRSRTRGGIVLDRSVLYSALDAWRQSAKRLSTGEVI